MGVRRDEVMPGPRGGGGAGGDAPPRVPSLPIHSSPLTLMSSPALTPAEPPVATRGSLKDCDRNPETPCLLWASVSLYARWETTITQGQTSGGRPWVPGQFWVPPCPWPTRRGPGLPRGPNTPAAGAGWARCAPRHAEGGFLAVHPPRGRDPSASPYPLGVRA